MEIILREKPKNPVIIQGLPGIGMVGAIAAEFLLQHLDCRLIGKILVDKTPPLVAVHEGQLIEPYSIYYSKKLNIVIVHSIVSTPGSEWDIADAVASLCNELNAREVISLEGIGSTEEKAESNTFYYTRSTKMEKTFKTANLKPLKEGIIMGQTSALLVKADLTPISCIFAETHSNLPDSKAAAEIIKVLDVVLGLKVDYKPLLKVAGQFEEKIKGIMASGEKARDLQRQKQMSYVG